MRTSKPFATISYNTQDFLISKLNSFINVGALSFWAFIEHLPEEDEKKKHKHLFFVPNGIVQTEKVIEELKEFERISGDKVLYLGCINAVHSKFDDWYFYAIHDRNYLALKGQSRKYHYTDSDIIVSDSDYFLELKHSIDYSKINTVGKIADRIQQGETDWDIVQSFGLNQVRNVLEVCKAFRCGRSTYRTDMPEKHRHEQ